LFPQYGLEKREGSLMTIHRSKLACVSARLLKRTAILALALAGLCVWPSGQPQAQTKPEGEMRWAIYVTPSPGWLDPAEAIGQLTPFWFLYAIHDALVKPMPGSRMAPSLAESWTVSEDQRAYEFKLREGLRFHNGDPFTAEDVKFSFQRTKGVKVLIDKVREIEVVGPYRVRFHLHEPWPDFMTFYGTIVSTAGWIVPKAYVEGVGDAGFKKHPIGLGPYKFVSHTPGVELVMEAFEGYWRKMPSVKRLVFKSVPDATARLAMLKRGEVDIAYLLDAPDAAEVKRDPSLRLARISHTTECIGAANQRKLLCCNSLSRIQGAPRCRQSVPQICLNLHLLKDAKW
jgi:peptide/nickel transport system substrate-binding protein